MHLKQLSIALLLALSANSVHAMDLLDAWRAAQSKDPQFSAARAGAEAGKKKIDQAKALGLPQVTATAGTGAVNSYNKITNAQFSAPGLGSAGGAAFKTQTDLGVDLRWQVSAEQPLYNAERASTARQLNKQAQLADVKFSVDAQQLILRVAKAYFDVLLAEDTLASVKKQRAAVAQALAVAKGRFKEGDVAIIDTHEAQARDDALVSQEMEADSNYQLAQSVLMDLTGGNADSPLARPSEQANFQQLNSGELNDWLTLAQSNSPYLHLQQIKQGITHDEIDKHKSLTAPVLNLVAQAGGEELAGVSGANSELSNHSVSVGVQLTIPLFTGGMRNAKYEEAVALDTQAKDETEVMRQRAGQEARSAWMGVTVGKSKVKALEQALTSSKVKLDATELGREVGDRTTLDVLNAEQDYYNTRTELFRVRYQTLLSFLSLAATAGTLDEKHLADVNAILK
ncbi:outer membrane protein TolC precursor [mine drainage metagenome]|uniref:Outer membrane protein TolC n=1 Tax=mine drainage metagenome TaxID=410659 RepID=A0A1J5TAA1_9ZZZZ